VSASQPAALQSWGGGRDSYMLRLPARNLAHQRWPLP
jgi:hypothetical protein